MNKLPVENVLAKLQELTQGLTYLSESDYPVEVVQFTASTTQELTPEEILPLVQQPPKTKVEIRDLSHFFRNVTKPEDGMEGLDSPSKRYQALEAFLTEQLQNVKVYRIGKRNLQVYVLGKLDEATYAGVKTTVATSDN